MQWVDYQHVPAAIRNDTSAHWPVAAYGVVLIGLASPFSGGSGDGRGPPRAGLPGVWILGATASWSIALVVATLLPALVAVRGHAVNEGYGWEEAGRHMRALHRRLGPKSLVAADNYALASLLSFYNPGHLYVGVLGPGSKHGRAYDLWDDWAAWAGRNVVCVSSEPVTRESEGGRILRVSCRRYEVLAPLLIKRRSRVVLRSPIPVRTAGVAQVLVADRP